MYGKVNSNGKTSTLTPLVNTYVSLLNNSIGGAEATGRLISYEELINLGCTEDDGCKVDGVSSWLYQTSYWTGTSSSSESKVKAVLAYDGIMYSALFYDGTYGLRPVIELNESVIEK